tara:strand:+ start:228 stop:542 length:315 start_codon:yes stop_codon:yes gene_type:complete
MKSKLTKQQRLEIAKKEHRKFLLSVGLPIDIRNRVIIKQRVGTPFPDLSTSDVYNSKHNISGVGLKKSRPSPYIPAGKTVGIGYNKGTYQLVDGPDIKTMGRKV